MYFLTNVFSFPLARRMIKYIFTLACVWASSLGAPDVGSLSQAYIPPKLTPSPLPLAPSSPKPMQDMNDLPVCFPKTHFVTLTSTQVVPSLVYNTRTLLVPTTVSQVRTSSKREPPLVSAKFFPIWRRREDEIYSYFLPPVVNKVVILMYLARVNRVLTRCIASNEYKYH